jgi:hypothetical protein
VAEECPCQQLEDTGFLFFSPLSCRLVQTALWAAPSSWLICLCSADRLTDTCLHQGYDLQKKQYVFLLCREKFSIMLVFIEPSYM